MPNYAYKARDSQNKQSKGIISAENETDLYAKLSKIGYFLTESQVVNSSVGASNKRIGNQPVMKEIEVLQFTTQLAISVQAGVPLLGTLRDLARTAPNKNVKAVIDDVAFRVESGTSLKEALSQHPRSFSKLYTSIVDAGESSGRLPLVLSDIGRLLEWQMDLKSKVVEASIYPAILFIVMIGVVAVLLAVVIPKFEPMLKDMGAEMPLPTVIILSISKIIQSFWWVILMLIAGMIGAYMYFNAREKGRYVIDKYKLRLPIMGDLLGKIALSRFCHTFSLSLKSGVPVFSALAIASQVVGNKVLEVSISKARDYVNIGEKVSSSLELAAKESGKPFPHIVIRMISIGEQSGTLAETLEKVNEYYDKEIPATVRKIFAMLEPMMIVIMGVVVAGIALAVFLPMMQMITSVGE